MLRDRLVGGMRDEAIQRRLLAESNLTFDLAQKIAIAAETAHKNTEEIRTPSNEITSIQQVTLNERVSPSCEQRIILAEKQAERSLEDLVDHKQ
ncbi:D-amino acid dehydrogenase [Trichinella spiralis]|uniref:D-amino acid dehydrogenase n=1 Tax=Trichinella spiralis TaxID=6334 RepID=A0ABR3K7W9_TRISP